MEVWSGMGEAMETLPGMSSVRWRCQLLVSLWGTCSLSVVQILHAYIESHVKYPSTYPPCGHRFYHGNSPTRDTASASALVVIHVVILTSPQPLASFTSTLNLLVLAVGTFLCGHMFN